MLPAPLIGIDWGTSRMRAILCRADASADDKPEILVGAGIAAMQSTFEDALFTTIEPWTAAYGRMPVVMSGMIGSNIGWKVAPYLECPTPIRSIRRHRKSFDVEGHRLSIVPGVSCRNAFDQPDFMRGEELQILGWYEKEASRTNGEYIICLPGTHTKWARFADGGIVTFMTALSGELYAVLCGHSILLPDAGGASRTSFEESAFRDGLALAQRSGGDLLNTLFSVRSRQIATPENAGHSASYLSGLIVGADVLASLKRFKPQGGTIELIGDTALCRKFTVALDSFGLAANVTDGIDAAYHGFRSFHRVQL